MPSALIGVDMEGKITQWNQQAREFTKASAEQAIGQPFSTESPRLAAQLQDIHDAMQNNEQRAEHKRSFLKNGETRYEDITIYPLITNGENGVVLRLDDVTEKVHLEEMIIQSEKMLSVGGLAAGIAHEINNPLAGMLQTTNVIRNRLSDKSMPANIRAAEAAHIDLDSLHQFMEAQGILDLMDNIITSGQSVAKIIENMLNFSAKSNSAVSSHNISELLDKTLDLSAADYDLKKQYDFKSIKLIKHYAENLPLVPSEGAKISQVILNLLRNGAQAMQDTCSGAPTLTLSTYLDQQQDSVYLEIEDNGSGIDEATRKRVFEPFFTTKPVRIGTGLRGSSLIFI